MNAFTWVVLIAGIVFFGIQAVALKKIKVTSLRENILSTALFSTVVAIGFWIFTLVSKGVISRVTFGFGVLFGVVFIATITTYYYALHTGPMSYTSFFYTASLIIPSLAGMLIWHEAVRWVVLCGIALFLIAFFLISIPGAEKGKKINKKWMVLCLVTCVLNGSLSVIVKAQQMTVGGEAPSMTTVAFTSAAVLCFLTYFILCFARKSDITVGQDIKHMIGSYSIPLLAMAVGNGGGNFVLTYLSAPETGVPAAVLFPVVQGGMMIAVTAYSVLLLKEKINKWGVVGILTGLAALIVINLPF